MWKAVETKTGKAGMVEVERRRDQARSRKKVRRARKKEPKEEEGGRSKKSGGGVGDLGRGRGSSKVRRGSKETGPQKVSSENKSVWQETIGENAHTKDLGLCYQPKRRVHAKKGEDIPIVKGRERGSMRIHTGTIEERIHLTLEVAPNGTSILCREEGWKKEDSIGLLVP